MKYLKLFESHNKIDTICKEYNIENYRINPDSSIDVDNEVDIHYMGLTEIPIRFGTVTGDFENILICDNNYLTTLENVPEKVGCFYCSNNPLTSLLDLFRNLYKFIMSLDFKYIRKTNIVKSRFQEACREDGIRMPEKIEGYNYI